MRRVGGTRKDAVATKGRKPAKRLVDEIEHIEEVHGLESSW